MDIREEVAKLFPSMGSCSLLKVKDMSTIARYGNHPATEIGGFYNIYVTWVQKSLRRKNPELEKLEERDLQLVSLAALADIMPMRNENRLFVKKGLESINKGNIREGLHELMAKLSLTGKKVSSTDLSWNVVSNLNAAGRLGQPELAARLFLSKSADERNATASAIMELNAKRKELTLEAWEYAQPDIQTSIEKHGGKLCAIFDSRVNRGVCGLLAGRITGSSDVPSMVVTEAGELAIGSRRSCRGLDLTSFLNSFGDIFENHGGHCAAAGFSLKRRSLNFLKKRSLNLLIQLNLRLLLPAISK